MKIFLFSILLAMLISQPLLSQNDEVRENLKLVAKGQVDEAKKALPDLLAEFPNHPGVMLLHAVVIEDAFRAIEIYEKIVANHSDSPWADDAYWRIVQFHSVIGDTAKAQSVLNEFRDKYPSSEFLAPATDIVHSAIIIARSDKKRSNRIDEQATARETQSADENESHAVETKTEAGRAYGLQVGIYSTMAAAENEMERFTKMRLRTMIMPKQVDSVTMYAVVIGNYPDRESAEAAKPVVRQQCNCEPIIFLKDKK
jgi:tetratricopeptide (TPR) repeat protein